MAKLYFKYGTMGSGKSIDLLKVAYNYTERNQNVLLFNSKLDERFTSGCISTRIGIEKESLLFESNTSFIDVVSNIEENISCILIDEAQFLKKNQVDELGMIADNYDIPVICYGLKTDFKTELFEGSKRLLEIADKLEEIRTICVCGKKAINNARLVDNHIVNEGEQILIGDLEYKAFCRSCYNNGLSDDGYLNNMPIKKKVK